jgi:hypothetical protein
VRSIVSEGSRGFVLRAMGNVRKAHRHSSLTLGLDAKLEEQWTYENDDIGAFDIVPMQDGVLAVGYRGGGEGNPAKVSLESLSAAGHPEGEWMLGRAPDDLFPGAALKLTEESVVVAIDQHPQLTTPEVKPAEERLILLEARLGKPARIRVDMGLGSNGMRYLSMARLGNAVLVAVTEMFAPINGDSYFDEFHQLRGCLTAPNTKLLLFDSSSWRLLWEKELSDIAMLQGANSPDGTAYFVGAFRKSCDEGNRLGFWRISKTRDIKTIYADTDFAQTQGTGMELRPDGSALLFGKVERLTDVASLEERDTTKMIGRSTMQRVNFSTRETSDLVLGEVDSSGKLISRETVRAGSDLYVRGAVSVGKDVWIYGALGNEAALMQLRARH